MRILQVPAKIGYFGSNNLNATRASGPVGLHSNFATPPLGDHHMAGDRYLADC